MAVDPLRAVGTAFSWLTVFPVPSTHEAPDRRVGAAAITAVPVVGAALGALAACAALGLSYTRAPTLLIGLLVVGLLALLTRGMHVDGLADTADGLGCYGSPERVREVMRGGSAGPFAIATLVLVLGIDAVCVATLANDRCWYAIGFAVMLSRVAAVVACRWTLTPSSPDGFGALVAGSQRWSIVVWTAVALAVAYPAGLAAMATVPVAAVAIWWFSAHCARRMGGINGDVLGASIELTLAISLAVLVCAG
ncbi:adenosylcobinamide-GDP ribazoletransferase [Gordonia sp. TBRC 11910]|uniref:Adenosylcobinamide-GDP ribazoletransferase n=1 Tax=Gordonia asplenii TaxID=2725283 RepID=A0A848L450_9ACTN|nr:adenosylcobinamide-GDP ribazoletransferase [Gordonia asplenii]NMO03373.1 adenosylcobinamide-GDP ribazoletransferase [Gordonia asplenii]